MPRHATLVALLLVTACAAPQRPYSFEMNGARPDVLGDVVRAFAAHGEQAQRVDRDAGVIHTGWVDTGFMYGSIQDVTATIVRRYTAILQPRSGDYVVTLRADVQRCAQGSWTVEGGLLVGTCEAIDGLVPDHQADLDRMGLDVQSTLTTGLVAVAP